MPVHTIPLGPLDTNCHIVYNEDQCVVVDPGGAPDAVITFITKRGLKVEAILITHLHFDHIYGVAALHEATQAPVYTPAGDARLMQSELGSGGAWGFPQVTPFTSVPMPEKEYDFGKLHCVILPTPGHTPGSVSLYFASENALCAGDVLFYRSVGRTDFPGGSQETLMESIKNQIFTLPGTTVVYPGHGPDTTVEDEKAHNPYCGSFSN